MLPTKAHDTGRHLEEHLRRGKGYKSSWHTRLVGVQKDNGWHARGNVNRIVDAHHAEESGR